MRYIGNKAKLLPAISQLLEDKGINVNGQTFCDLFSGTATVGDFLKHKFKIIANDTLMASYYTARGKLCRPCNFESLGINPFEYFNQANTDEYTNGFCYNNFAPTISGRMYFSDENAKFIDFIRDTIDEWYSQQLLTLDEKCYLIASLLESVSKVSNVAGVYSAFLRIWDPRAIKRMVYVPVESMENVVQYDNDFYSEDANSLIEHINGDILYLDPPYTPTQYISQYHVLETIAKNDHPVTHGVGAHRDNGNQISNWCKKEIVGAEFVNLIAKAKFKYILFSYSDAGIMSKEFIEKTLKRFAIPGTYECRDIDFVKYKSTRAVNREIADNTKDKKHFEWLFFIEKNDHAKYISPLNYIGGKYDLIPLIQQNLPTNIDKFYDLFGGGGTVSINAQAKQVIYNDINWIVKDLLLTIAEQDIDKTVKYITKTIDKFHLNKGNKDAYIALREWYNSKEINSRNPLDLYLLICYGFEHQIRFNSDLEFNNPCGNSGFNQEMLEKLISFSFKAKNMNICFASADYSQFESEISTNDFVYCDPPYLISCGAYNDGKRGFNGWDEEQEQNLLDFLLRLHLRGVKFMLSNMADRNGECNTALNTWIQQNHFRVIKDTKLTKRNRQDRYEILVINY